MLQRIAILGIGIVVQVDARKAQKETQPCKRLSSVRLRGILDCNYPKLFTHFPLNDDADQTAVRGQNRLCFPIWSTNISVDSGYVSGPTILWRKIASNPGRGQWKRRY